ncbi:MAG: hypothetical protein K8F60_18690 [Melioribacteraceae bacterium]|nr:hypothetical protein [Melioribacteraceae bacterium]
MGQQQLLLIVLGVIIVGIAVVVGINVFTSSAQNSNRDLVVSQLTNLGAAAQQYFRKPEALGGGGNSFSKFTLNSADIENAAGNFALSASAVTALTAVTASADSVSGVTTTIYIVGSGTEIGNDDENPVKALATVTRDDITTTILN